MKAQMNIHHIDYKALMQNIGARAKAAAAILAIAPAESRNKALSLAASGLRAHTDSLLAENKNDVEDARSAGLDIAMIDRLTLNPARIEAMASALETVAALNDPVGKILAAWDRPNGLHITRRSVPLGVIGMIYESRPNVTADAAGICLKSGNAVILRGGSESLRSSLAIVEVLHTALEQAGLPVDAVQIVPTTDRGAVGEMLQLTDYIDVIIPRGGASLTKRISEESKVPTLLHLTGNCHSYIHKDADLAMALSIVMNAKMRRTGICGATESLVIDSRITPAILPQLVNELTAVGCGLRGDLRAQTLDARIQPAAECDWATEYLCPLLSIKIVDTLEEAISHINRYGSHHTDAIITANDAAAQQFLQQVESAIVMHNTSTQFADGGEFGMGAEIGIATGKLHARGPVGVEQLTTYKYEVKGCGQVRPV
jgi:glutamate-5-semialdehyde dehydrogenase